MSTALEEDAEQHDIHQRAPGLDEHLATMVPICDQGKGRRPARPGIAATGTNAEQDRAKRLEHEPEPPGPVRRRGRSWMNSQENT